MTISIFEAIMITAFGISWPISIIKTIRSSSVAGKSILFLIIIFLGYCAGIVHKVLYARDFVIILYIINGLLVLTDLAIVLYKMENSPLRKLFPRG
ncbi:MAG: hypothetical protein AABZ39_07415 [Spirochaetota bacterium]